MRRNVSQESVQSGDPSEVSDDDAHTWSLSCWALGFMAVQSSTHLQGCYEKAMLREVSASSWQVLSAVIIR